VRSRYAHRPSRYLKDKHDSSAILTANFGIVIVESVGLGQSEVEIDIAVDMVLIVVPPGGGDGLQATKKGRISSIYFMKHLFWVRVRYNGSCRCGVGQQGRRGFIAGC
jgi:hypothetical protein